MPIPGNLLTTAMAVMPHIDVERALEIALSLDIPFWPQLPNFSYYEDMYVQAAEHFPGILLDVEKRTLRFSIDKFISERKDTWQVLTKKGIDRTVLLEKSLLSPATCCLVNPDREKTVEKAFESITLLSRMLREKYRIDD